MGSEEPTVRITAEEEIQAPLNQLPPDKALRATSPLILADICFLSEILGQGFTPESQLTSCGVFWQTALDGGRNRLQVAV